MTELENVQQEGSGIYPSSSDPTVVKGRDVVSEDPRCFDSALVFFAFYVRSIEAEVHFLLQSH